MIKHSEEFKREAVRIALTSGLPRARVAADLGVGKSTLGQSLGGSGWQTIGRLICHQHRKPISLWRMSGFVRRTAC
jgi:hypothetical protein